jgi:hypothetical protein
MAERQVPCPRCSQENPPTNLYCGSCGVPLTSGEQLATREEHSPVQAGRAWPAKLSPAGKALAVGVAAWPRKPDCPGCAAGSGQKIARRGPPSEALAPPRAVISSGRVWKKSFSRRGRIPTAGSPRGERSDRSSPRGDWWAKVERPLPAPRSADRPDRAQGGGCKAPGQA